MAATVRVPPGLGVKGTKLWRELHKDSSWNPAEEVLVEEACRIADRLDRLNAMLVGEEDAWMKIRSTSEDGSEITVVVDSALSEARQQANVLKQIVAALRLPEGQTAERPQRRGGGRGAYSTAGKAVTKRAASGTVTAIGRALAAAGG